MATVRLEEGTDGPDGIPSRIGQQDVADASEVTAQGGTPPVGTLRSMALQGDPGSARTGILSVPAFPSVLMAHTRRPMGETSGISDRPGGCWTG